MVQAKKKLAFFKFRVLPVCPLTIEVVIGLRPATLLHITMVDYLQFPPKGTSRIYSKGCSRRNIQTSHQGRVLYPHQNYPYYYYPNMPPHPHSRIPPHPICLCPYFTFNTIYASYGVAQHT